MDTGGGLRLYGDDQRLIPSSWIDEPAATRFVGPGMYQADKAQVAHSKWFRRWIGLGGVPPDPPTVGWKKLDVNTL